MNYAMKANFKLENSTLSKRRPVFFCILEQTQKVANPFQKTPKPLITTITQNNRIKTIKSILIYIVLKFQSSLKFQLISSNDA